MKKSLITGFCSLFFVLFIVGAVSAVNQCIDSDNGNVYLKGNVIEGSESPLREHIDSCKNSKQLTEGNCLLGTDNNVEGVFYVEGNVDCPYGCLEGACIPAEKAYPLFCSENDYQCGLWSSVDTDFYLGVPKDDPLFNGLFFNCGKCDNGACILGKCYPSDKMGKCVSLPYGKGNLQTESGTIEVLAGEKIPCNVWSDTKNIGGDKHTFCIEYGCFWDETTRVCSGVSKSCPDLSLDECNSRIGFLLDCSFDGSFTKKLYWTGTKYFNKDILTNLQKGGTIPFTINFVDPLLLEGTELTFDVYSFDYNKFVSFEKNSPGSDKGWFKNSEPLLLKTFSGQINSKSEASIVWNFSVEDLNKINYKGEVTFVVEISFKNGTKIVIADNSLPMIGGFAEVDGNLVSTLNLPPNIDRNKLGTIISVDYPLYNSFMITTATQYCHGTLSCNIFTSKSQCEFVSKEAKSISETGFLEEDFGYCAWNEDSSSCEGKTSCVILNKDECGISLTSSCSWKSDSFFEKFVSWFKRLFER